MTLVILLVMASSESALAAPTSSSNETSASTKRNGATTTALELIQEHALGGPERILISKRGLRMENLNTGVVILSTAPFTEVYWTNPKKKLFYSMPTSKSTVRMDAVKYVLDTTSEFTEIPWEPPQDTTLMGRPAIVYTKTTPKKSWCKYWVLKEPKVKPDILKIVCSFSGSLPQKAGVPVQWHQYVQKADMINELEDNPQPELRKFFVTKSIKEINVPLSSFVSPSDYQRAKKRNDVMASSVGFGSYRDMLKSPDFLFQSSSKKLNGIQETKLEKNPKTKNEAVTGKGRN